MSVKAALSMQKPPDGVQLSVSVICLNQLNLEQVITDVLASGVQRLHIDFIDNAYGGLGLPRETLRDLRASFNVPLDVHLMVTNLQRAIDWVLSDGADYLLVHQQHLTPALVRQLRRAHEVGVEIGLVLNPGESPDEDIINLTGAKRLTAMSVEPGGAGRPFDPRALDTLRQARALVGRTSLREIEVDGAVGPKTCEMLRTAGADIFVVGSTVLPNRTMAGNKLNEILILAKPRKETQAHGIS